MFTKKLIWVLVIGFLNVVSVDAKERSIIPSGGERFLKFQFSNDEVVLCYKLYFFKLEILMSILLSDPKFKLAIEGVLLSIVAIFGLIGNSLAIAVLSRPSMRSPINLILIGT